MKVVYSHFKDILNGKSIHKSPPLLLVTGAPGTGKSWLIQIITEIAEMTDLDAPIRAAWMGIAAINIGGSTLCTLFDIPTNQTKDIKPWNANCLEEFKRKFNMDKISVIIIDEISMIKAWMLTYLDARLKQATQIQIVILLTNSKI